MDEQDQSAAIRDYLSEHAWKCDVCGYQLLGLREPRCPECGGEIKIGRRLLGPPKPVPGWCWGAVGIDVAVCLGAGFANFLMLGIEGALMLAIFLAAPALLWVGLWELTSRDATDRKVNQVLLPWIVVGTAILAAVVIAGS